MPSNAVKILRNINNFWRNDTEWLANPGGTNLSKLTEEMSKKRTECFCEEFLHVREEERLHVTLQNFY